MCVRVHSFRRTQFEVEAKELELSRLLAEEEADSKAADEVCVVCLERLSFVCWPHHSRCRALLTTSRAGLLATATAYSSFQLHRKRK